jgi:hypothetical protein
MPRRIPMNVLENILLMLGEIKGEFVEMRKLNERVARLEMWNSWLKGAALVAYILIFRSRFPH